MKNRKFEGIKLNEKQRNVICINMKSELGEQNYAFVENFFDYILNSEARYKVILSQSCLNLFNLYYRGKYEFPLAEIEDRVISDSALFAYIPDIVSEYLEWGFFPEILIADDILVRGKKINLLLDTFILKVYNYIKEKSVHKEYLDIEGDISKAISIITIMQSDNTFLMKPIYYQRLFNTGYEFNVCKPVVWHEFSLKISMLNIESVFSNTSYTLSLYEENSEDKRHKYIVDVLQKQGFICSEWDKRNQRNVWVKPLFYEGKGIIAFYTISITQNFVLNDFRVKPFIVLPDLDMKYGMHLFDRIFSNNIVEQIKEMSQAQNQIAELLYLVLNYNILLLLNYEDERISLSNDVLDIDKILWNFGVSTIFGQAIKELLKHKSPFLSWKGLNTFIIKGSESFEPIMDLHIKQVENKYRDFNEAFEEIIADESEKAELEAAQEYEGQKYIAEKRSRQSIRELFDKIIQSTKSECTKQQIIELIANMMRQWEVGFIELNVEQIEGYYSLVYRV